MPLFPVQYRTTRWKRIAAALTCLSLLPITAPVAVEQIEVALAASTLYVDGSLGANCTSGNYSVASRACSGSDGNAYTTVNGGIAASASGDTLLVRAGTYGETKVISAVPVREASFHINKALTLRAYTGEEVVLTYDPDNLPNEDTQVSKIVFIDANNVTLDGFTIPGTKLIGDNPSYDTDVSVLLNGNVANITIKNNKIYNFGHAGIKAGALTGPVTIEHNEFSGGFDFRDHGMYFTDSSSHPKVIRYNYFHDISGYGIHLYNGENGTSCTDGGANYFEIYGNVFHDIMYGSAILLGGAFNTVYNNTIFANSKQATQVGGIHFWKGESHDNVVKNNIIWGNTSAPDILME